MKTIHVKVKDENDDNENVKSTKRSKTWKEMERSKSIEEIPRK